MRYVWNPLIQAKCALSFVPIETPSIKMTYFKRYMYIPNFMDYLHLYWTYLCWFDNVNDASVLEYPWYWLTQANSRLKLNSVASLIFVPQTVLDVYLQFYVPEYCSIHPEVKYGHSLASFLTDWTTLYVLLYICIRCTFSYE